MNVGGERNLKIFNLLIFDVGKVFCVWWVYGFVENIVEGKFLIEFDGNNWIKNNWIIEYLNLEWSIYFIIFILYEKI